MSRHFGWTMVGQIIQGRLTYMTWKKSKFKGVRYREHNTRKHGKMRDRYYTIFYKLDGKMHQEALGWASESWEEVDAKGNKKTFRWTETRAAEVLAELKKNQRTGSGPRTLKEKRTEQERILAIQKAESITLSEFWDQDYVIYLKGRIKSSSWKKEITHFEKRIRPLLGDHPIKKISSEDIDKLIEQMRAEGLAPRTQQYAVGTLFRIWKHAAKRKFVKQGNNPATGIQLEKINNTRLRVLFREELKQILDYLFISDISAHDISMFCAFTGCRFSEAAKLTWEHVDFNRNSVLFAETKNGDSREIHLETNLIELLQNRNPGQAGQSVFTKKDGSLYKEPPSAFKTAVDNLGLNKDRSQRDRVTFHTLRHTAATIAARNGTSVKDLQIMFGWKTPSMVFRYVKGDKKSQQEAMKGLFHSLADEENKITPIDFSKTINN